MRQLTITMQKQMEAMSGEIKDQGERVQKMEVALSEGLAKVTIDTNEKFHQHDLKIEGILERLNRLEKENEELKSHQENFKQKGFSIQLKA